MALAGVHGNCSNDAITLALEMLKNGPNQIEFVDFYLPLNGRLKSSNRWGKLASLMPWYEVECCYSSELVFDFSMMVHFRERFSEAHHRRISERLIKGSTGSERVGKADDSDAEPPSNSGKLLVDAISTPADIKYPTDLGLLNEAREKTESLIDRMHGRLRQFGQSQLGTLQ